MELTNHFNREWSILLFKFIITNLKTDLRKISKNKNITMDIINSFTTIDWNWFDLSYNPNITMDDILNNLDKPWILNGIECNPNITTKMILANKTQLYHLKTHCYESDGYYSSMSRRQVWESLESREKQRFPFGFNQQTITETNPPRSFLVDDITFDMYLEAPDAPTQFTDSTKEYSGYFWIKASKSRCITLDIIENNPHKPWNWYWISYNPNITIDFVLKHGSEKFDWYWLSKNPAITMEVIEKHNNQCWDFKGISENPNVTINMIAKHYDKPWNWLILSNNGFEQDKIQFVSNKVMGLNLATIHENYNNFDDYDVDKPYTLFEQILADSYLVKTLVQF